MLMRRRPQGPALGRCGGRGGRTGSGLIETPLRPEVTSRAIRGATGQRAFAIDGNVDAQICPDVVWAAVRASLSGAPGGHPPRSVVASRLLKQRPDGAMELEQVCCWRVAGGLICGTTCFRTLLRVEEAQRTVHLTQMEGNFVFRSLDATVAVCARPTMAADCTASAQLRRGGGRPAGEAEPRAASIRLVQRAEGQPALLRLALGVQSLLRRELRSQAAALLEDLCAAAAALAAREAQLVVSRSAAVALPAEEARDRPSDGSCCCAARVEEDTTRPSASTAATRSHDYDGVDDEEALPREEEHYCNVVSHPLGPRRSAFRY